MKMKLTGKGLHGNYTSRAFLQTIYKKKGDRGGLSREGRKGVQMIVK